MAERLSLPLLDRLPDSGVVLLIDTEGPALQCLGKGMPGPVRFRFADPGLRHRRRGGQNELLGRAVGWKAARPLSILDATAGLGRDAFVLADLGCSVTLCERSPAVAALLEEAVNSARRGDAWLREVAGRMQVRDIDARALAPERLTGHDVIYLDPMFPAPRRALPSKEMQVLHAVLGPIREEEQASDNEALLAWGLEQPVARVVAKRPLRASPLPGRAPSHTLRGRSVRFDVYTLDRLRA